ncbi:MAG: thioredoxin [Sedimenticola sp.]|nr:MAG: thioredoxin [Sedimenticola sp.]
MTDYHFTPLDSLDALNQCIREHPAVLIWFTGPDCRVCQDLKPKIGQLMAEHYPQLALAQIDCAATPDAAAQQQVFSVPTLLIFLDGQEFIRKSRSFSPAQLASELERPYGLYFGE